MPPAKLNVDRRASGSAPPTAISQPVRGSRRRSRVSTSSAEPGDEREAEQPAGLVAEPRLQQPERTGGAAEQVVPPPPGPPAPAARRAAGLPGDAAEAVVAEDQRPDAVVRGARDPRPVGGRRQASRAAARRGRRRPSQHRRRAAARSAREPTAQARPDPDPRGRDPRHDHQRDAHLRLEPEADGDRR